MGAGDAEVALVSGGGRVLQRLSCSQLGLFPGRLPVDLFCDRAWALSWKFLPVFLADVRDFLIVMLFVSFGFSV